MKSYYANLSDQYGFKIIPLEDSFYFSQTLLGTARRLKRQKRNDELNDLLQLAIDYYPNSKVIKSLVSKKN